MPIIYLSCWLSSSLFSFLVRHFLYSIALLNDFSTLLRMYVYTATIIILKSVCGSSQVSLDRFGRCLKLFVSTVGLSYHEFVSQFGLAIFIGEKHIKTLADNRVARASVRLNEPRPVTLDRQRPVEMGGNCVVVRRQRPIEPRLAERCQLRS